MKVIKLSQRGDREAWLDLRRGLITGTKARGIRPLIRGADRTPMGFWSLLAEKVSIASDGEPDMDRGQRLEKDAVEQIAKKYKLDVDDDPGMWVSSDSPEIGLSPDAAEKASRPTWAIEAKALATKNHLKFIFKDKLAHKEKDYRAINSVPNEGTTCFKEQVIQYFVVNERLKMLYFGLYDDRVAFDKYILHVIKIEREDIKDEIKEQKEVQLNALKEINLLIKEIKNEQ